MRGNQIKKRRRRFDRVGERVAMFLLAGGKCQGCGEPLEKGWHGDHVKPFSKGGETDIVNAQALCPKCNIEKGNKDG